MKKYGGVKDFLQTKWFRILWRIQCELYFLGRLSGSIYFPKVGEKVAVCTGRIATIVSRNIRNGEITDEKGFVHCYPECVERLNNARS